MRGKLYWAIVPDACHRGLTTLRAISSIYHFLFSLDFLTIEAKRWRAFANPHESGPLTHPRLLFRKGACWNFMSFISLSRTGLTQLRELVSNSESDGRDGRSSTSSRALDSPATTGAGVREKAENRAHLHARRALARDQTQLDQAILEAAGRQVTHSHGRASEKSGLDLVSHAEHFF